MDSGAAVSRDSGFAGFLTPASVFVRIVCVVVGVFFSGAAVRVEGIVFCTCVADGSALRVVVVTVVVGGLVEGKMVVGGIVVGISAKQNQVFSVVYEPNFFSFGDSNEGLNW